MSIEKRLKEDIESRPARVGGFICVDNADAKAILHLIDAAKGNKVVEVHGKYFIESSELWGVYCKALRNVVR